MTARTLQAVPFVRARFLGVAMLGAYLVLNVFLAACAPFTADWPIYGVTALVVPPMVLTMIYAVIPLARRASR